MVQRYIAKKRLRSWILFEGSGAAICAVLSWVILVVPLAKSAALWFLYSIATASMALIGRCLSHVLDDDEEDSLLLRESQAYMYVAQVHWIAGLALALIAESEHLDYVLAHGSGAIEPPSLLLAVGVVLGDIVGTMYLLIAYFSMPESRGMSAIRSVVTIYRKYSTTSFVLMGLSAGAASILFLSSGDGESFKALLMWTVLFFAESTVASSMPTTRRTG